VNPANEIEKVIVQMPGMRTTNTLNAHEKQELIDKVLAGDFRSIARLVTMVENGSADAIPFLRELFPHTGRCFTIGLTGAPGAGKSTLVDRLAGMYRDQEKKIAIIAVDPSSPYTGGAILGDRIRMQSRTLDQGTFIRSMATRGHIGGLANATADVLNVMDAAGFEIVLVETVGVGQDEVEIAKTADATIVLLVPGMGDDIQMMKAGIMEIADIFVINKSDRPGADRIEAELKGHLSMSTRPDGWCPVVIRTVASEGSGIDECINAIEEYRSFLTRSEMRKDKIVRIQKIRLLELAGMQAREKLLKHNASADRVEELALLIADRKIDPYTAAEEVLQLQMKCIRQQGSIPR
jgi:LAO/AO transport system kinase